MIKNQYYKQKLAYYIKFNKKIIKTSQMIVRSIFKGQAYFKLNSFV